MQNIFIELLPPWIETGLQPAFYDKESGTVLQQVSRMWAKMIELGKAFNDFSEDTADTVNDYIERFTTLYTYVHDYFDNLDVQEEINNKLDDMVEAGTLQEIITDYIQANVAWTFDTVADMKLAENLIAGSFAQTLGFHTINDGGGATYYITNTGTANEMDVITVSDLYANLVKASEVTPEMYGAYGDGATDDTLSIIECFAKASNVIANNTYKCSFTGITISNSFTLKGKGTIILNTVAFSGNVEIDGITFEYDDTSTLGITLQGNNSYVTNCVFDNKDAEARVCLLEITGDNIVVTDSKFLNNSTGRAGVIAENVDGCIVKHCYFKDMGETAVSFKYGSTNCLADGNIAEDCSTRGELTDGVFSTYGDYNTGNYAKNIGFTNNIIQGSKTNYCFRFDGTESGYAKGNYVNIGDVLRVFLIQDRTDHDIKLYTKDIDITDNILTVDSTTNFSFIRITSAHNGLNINIKNNNCTAINTTSTSNFVEMAQSTSFSGIINVEDNTAIVTNSAISTTASVDTLVNYNVLHNQLNYGGRLMLTTSGRANVIGNLLQSGYNHMVYLKNCNYIIVNNVLTNTAQNPDIYNSGGATALTELSNITVDLS